MRAVSTGREGGGRPRGLSRPSGEMADQLLQGLLAGPAGAREELIFSLRFRVNQTEPDATAFYDGEWQVVDTRFGRAGCPAALSKKFPSLNQWAKAVKGRPVSVKPYIYFQGKSLREWENPKGAGAARPRQGSDGPSAKASKGGSPSWRGYCSRRARSGTR